MNTETFLAGLRELAHEPVPGPLPEQELVVRGRRGGSALCAAAINALGREAEIL